MRTGVNLIQYFLAELFTSIFSPFRAEGSRFYEERGGKGQVNSSFSARLPDMDTINKEINQPTFGSVEHRGRAPPFNLVSSDP